MLNIKSLKHLSLRLQINIDTIKEVSNSIGAHCSLIEIQKKGKTRLVFSTSDKLKMIQLAILNKLLSKIQINPSAHGAVKKKSPKTNALIHCGQRFVLCLDLKSCYPNIHSSRVRRLFEEKLGCSPSVSRVLTRLTTFNYHLAQGFHTSSAILNIICIDLDNNIEKYLANKNLFYTRYIDDITISGPFISQNTTIMIKEIVVKNGLVLNFLKEKFSNGNQAISVTGINISGRLPKVPRTYKRKLRAAEDQIQNNKQSRNPVDTAKQIKSIEGRKNYIKHIES